LNIVHISSDEKFINSIHWQFEEVFPDQNKYLIFLTKKNKSPVYVKVTKNVSLLGDQQYDLEKVSSEIENADLVILHGLKYFQSQIVLRAKDKIKFLWFFWGGEIYDNPEGLASHILGEKTKKKFGRQSIYKQGKNILRLLYYFLRGRMTPDKSILQAVKKIQFLGIIHKEEVLLLREKQFISPSAAHIKMTYYPLEFIFKGFEKITVNGRNILLGNSASLTNNHIEAFDLLDEFALEDRKLITPLSYGSKTYANSINRIGRERFPENFLPLLSFMSLSAYNEMLQGCSIVLMNHYRQQAVGNIVAMLWIGAKVYLNQSNTFYLYLKRLGVYIFSIEKEFKPDNPEALASLKLMEVAHNRQILKNEIGFEKLKKELKQQLVGIVNDT